ncbi:MAG: hypothetical protein R2752_16330 [Vicinamibacterales bacterium]
MSRAATPADHRGADGAGRVDGAPPRWWPWTLVALGYVALTVVYFLPLLRQLGTALPSDLGDPALNSWILWWNTQAMPFTERWWSPPMFYPVKDALALSETLIGLTPFTTPLQWLGAGPVLTHNVTLLLSYPATALAAHALAHRLTGRHDAALLAGLSFGFSPWRAAQLPHLQMMIAFWLPLGLLGLHRFLDDGRVRWAMLAAACWLGASLATGYYLVFFAVLIGLWMFWFARTRRQWAVPMAAFLAAALLMAPLLIAYQHRQSAMGLARGLTEIEAFSADLTAIWSATPRGDLLPSFWTPDPGPEGELYPGLVILVLGIAGAIAGWRGAPRDRFSRARLVLLVVAAGAVAVAAVSWAMGGFAFAGLSVNRPQRAVTLAFWLALVALISHPRIVEAVRRRSVALFYGAATVAMFVLALGPVARVMGEPFLSQAPYAWLMMLPGGDALRVPARFGILFMLCLGQVAAIVFARLTPRGAARPLVAGLALLIALDGYMPALAILPVLPPLDRQGLPPDALVLELPLDHHFADPKALLRQTVHRHPLINGYSGYQPPHYQLLAGALRDRIDPDVIEAFRRMGPIQVLVSRNEGVFEFYRDLMAAQSDALHIGHTPAGEIYRWPALPPIPRDATAERLPVAGLDASGRGANAPLMADDDLSSRWESAGPQTIGDEVRVHLAAPVAVTRLELDLGQWHGDYPRRLRVEVVPEDGGDPVRVWEEATIGETMLALLEDPSTTPLTIDLPAAPRTREVILTVTASDHQMSWTIAELRVWGHR